MSGGKTRQDGAMIGMWTVLCIDVLYIDDPPGGLTGLKKNVVKTMA